MIGGAVYLLGTCVALACGILLLRGYAKGKHKLLLWSGICFVGLAISNFFLFVDLILMPTRDLSLLRHVTTAVSMLLLLYGLIWEGE